MQARVILVALTCLSVSTTAEIKEHTGSNHLCRGFVEENDMQIPVSRDKSGEPTGLNEAQFHRVIDRFEQVYGPIIYGLGGQLEIDRRWEDPTVNASAQRMENDVWRINMYGGLARHPAVTADAFMLVVCHEAGHHLGGAPKYVRWWRTIWATNEGQSDYFASLKCVRKIWSDWENVSWLKNNPVDPAVKALCQHVYSATADYALCARTAMAGGSVANLFKDLRQLEHAPRYNTPDLSRVRRTSHSHPAPQCRMDTYFQGALCSRSLYEDVSPTDIEAGSCHRGAGDGFGVRPRCWYHPEDSPAKLDQAIEGQALSLESLDAALGKEVFH